MFTFGILVAVNCKKIQFFLAPGPFKALPWDKNSLLVFPRPLPHCSTHVKQSINLAEVGQAKRPLWWLLSASLYCHCFNGLLPKPTTELAHIICQLGRRLHTGFHKYDSDRQFLCNTKVRLPTDFKPTMIHSLCSTSSSISKSIGGGTWLVLHLLPMPHFAILATLQLQTINSFPPKKMTFVNLSRDGCKIWMVHSSLFGEIDKSKTIAPVCTNCY